MRILFLTLLLLLLNKLSGQSVLNPTRSHLDNVAAFMECEYDQSILKKNKVETVSTKSHKFFFDTAGLLKRAIIFNEAGKSKQELRFYFNSRGDLSAMESMDLITNTSYRVNYFYTYGQSGILKVFSSKDSSDSNAFTKQYHYNDRNILTQLKWESPQYGWVRTFTFIPDSVGMIKQVIDRQYSKVGDTAGEVLSNRSRFYDENKRLVREEEMAVIAQHRQTSIINSGTTRYTYDAAGNLTNILRDKGISQEIHFNKKGLITKINSTVRYMTGRQVNWEWKYTYTYRR